MDHLKEDLWGLDPDRVVHSKDQGLQTYLLLGGHGPALVNRTLRSWWRFQAFVGGLSVSGKASWQQVKTNFRAG